MEEKHSFGYDGFDSLGPEYEELCSVDREISINSSQPLFTRCCGRNKTEIDNCDQKYKLNQKIFFKIRYECEQTEHYLRSHQLLNFNTNDVFDSLGPEHIAEIDGLGHGIELGPTTDSDGGTLHSTQKTHEKLPTEGDSKHSLVSGVFDTIEPVDNCDSKYKLNRE